MQQDPPAPILRLLVSVVSKPSFLLLLLTVAILTATVGFQSAGGERAGNAPAALRFETRADIDTLKDDVRGVRDQALRTPGQLRNLLDETAKGFHSLTADVRVDARMAAHRLATFIKIS